MKQEKKEQKLQHINGTENILLKGCTTTSAQNYDPKSSGRPVSDAAWNSLSSRRFLAYRDIRALPSTEETGVSYI
ncbi:hypothetical protein TNCV_1653171 [Trichonephila clavipes]|nr:hypothetical protein TNCV_1653171 [Trichonephila clavipes]